MEQLGQLPIARPNPYDEFLDDPPEPVVTGVPESVSHKLCRVLIDSYFPKFYQLTYKVDLMDIHSGIVSQEKDLARLALDVLAAFKVVMYSGRGDNYELVSHFQIGFYVVALEEYLHQLRESDAEGDAKVPVQPGMLWVWT